MIEDICCFYSTVGSSGLVANPRETLKICKMPDYLSLISGAFFSTFFAKLHFIKLRVLSGKSMILQFMNCHFSNFEIILSFSFLFDDVFNFEYYEI
jgi:hypothetical protein